jgi:hypothetical protein
MGLMLVPISAWVSYKRAGTNIWFFDGGNETLGRAIRVQGNFIEYVPMAVILIGIVEWSGGASWMVDALGIALVAARLIHAWGLYSRQDKGRILGATVTWIVLAAGGILSLWAFAGA